MFNILLLCFILAISFLNLYILLFTVISTNNLEKFKNFDLSRILKENKKNKKRKG